MFDIIDDIKQYGSITLIIVSLFAILVSGLFFGITYYVMDTTNDAFQTTDCVIENNVYVDSCQDLWELSVYPFLALKELLIWFSFFFIFALAFGILVIGYQSGKSPVLLGVLVTFVMVITYVGIELSNIYRTMLENDVFRAMMLDFTVYNKIILNFPWFTFFIGLLAVTLSVVNFQKTIVNEDKEILDY